MERVDDAAVVLLPVPRGDHEQSVSDLIQGIHIDHCVSTSEMAISYSASRFLALLFLDGGEDCTHDRLDELDVLHALQMRFDQLARREMAHDPLSMTFATLRFCTLCSFIVCR